MDWTKQNCPYYHHHNLQYHRRRHHHWLSHIIGSTSNIIIDRTNDRTSGNIYQKQKIDIVLHVSFSLSAPKPAPKSTSAYLGQWEHNEVLTQFWPRFVGMQGDNCGPHDMRKGKDTNVRWYAPAPAAAAAEGLKGKGKTAFAGSATFLRRGSKFGKLDKSQPLPCSSSCKPSNICLRNCSPLFLSLAPFLLQLLRKWKQWLRSLFESQVLEKLVCWGKWGADLWLSGDTLPTSGWGFLQAWHFLYICNKASERWQTSVWMLCLLALFVNWFFWETISENSKEQARKLQATLEAAIRNYESLT